MTPYQQAKQDIKSELHKSSKSFIAFRTELNPIMRDIVEEYSKAQDKL